MSRCFSYPPPGYELSEDAKEALIETIKLLEEKQKRKEKSEERRKLEEEKKQQKKKQEEERREGRNHKKNQKLDKFDHDGQSSITEEHGDRVSFPGPTSSSDGTQTSNKRKRPSSSRDDNRGQSKLRMPAKEQNVFGISVMEQQACSSSGRTNDRLHQSKRRNGIRPSLPNGVASSMQIMEMQYKDLLDRLVPGLLHRDECLYSDNNLEWLFKSQDMQSGKRQRQRSGGSESSMSSCSRSSEFLRETGLLALPYTIPY